MAKSAIIFSDEDTSGAIEVTYLTISVTNSHIQRIEELKHGLLPTLAGKEAWPTIEKNCTALKNYMQEHTIVALEAAEEVVNKELSKYKWWWRF